MKTTSGHLILFAKAPEPGQVKTRLIPAIGAKAAASLYERMVLHCLTTAVNSGFGKVDLWCAPSARHPFFIRCAKKFNVELYTQCEGDIGQRMAHAFYETLKETAPVLLMGSDSLCLTSTDLKNAKELLQHDVDAVIGPVEDGGYVLLGLHRYASELFSGVSWGTELVMEQTRRRLCDLGWRWHELPLLWDVDRPEDVRRLVLEGYIDLFSQFNKKV